MEDDIYLRYFKYHHSLYQTVNNIGDNDVVEYEGHTLKIGWFKRTVRNKHSYYIKGENKRGGFSPLMLKRYEVLDELDFEWTPQKRLIENILTSDKYIRYLQEHYQQHGTINNIKYTDIVEYEGESLKIGVFIKSIRAAHKNYEQGIDEGKSFSKISLARYKALEEMDFCWNTKDEYYNDLLGNDPYIEFLKAYYQEHGTINDISNRAVVNYNGQTLTIGLFLKNIRNFHNNFHPEKRIYRKDTLDLYLKRKAILEEMNFEWTPFKAAEKSKMKSDPFLEYLKTYYKEHGTINDIPFSLEVDFNGQRLKIGEFLKSMRYNHKFYIAGEKRTGSATKIAIMRYQVLDELGFIWLPEKRKEYTGFARKNGLKPSTVSHLVKKFNGDVDKALSISMKRQKSRQVAETKRKKRNDLENIVSTFDVNTESFANYSAKTKSSIGKIKRETIMYDDKTTLAEFCLKNGYNYDVILRAFHQKMKSSQELDINTAIQECITEYNNGQQNTVSTWIYGKYNNEILAKHLLISLGLDYHALLRDMTNNSINIDEAIERECFRKSAKKEFSYLNGIFHETITFYHQAFEKEETTELSFYMELLKDKYHLSTDEFTCLDNALKKYIATIHKYHLYEVGFEKDKSAQIKKINAHKLTPDDIEIALFLPLQFENKVLIGKESKLSQRRNQLRNITLSWQDLSPDEQRETIFSCTLTSSEITFIEETSQEIVELKTKIHQKSR